MVCRGRILFLLALIILGIIFLHSYRFHQVEYRQDEINTVHSATVLDTAGIIEWLSYEGTHPLGWRIFASDWVKTFGYQRNIARFQSTLFTILALALTFRLSRDLFDEQVGLAAVLFIGILPYAQWHFHELRPYAPLIMISAALQVVFLRWILYQKWQSTLIYILLGAVGLQIHYFAGFIVVAHGIFLLIAVQWQPRRILHFGSLGGVILISFAWWIPKIYHGAFVIRDKGINYGTSSPEESFTTFFADLNYAPIVLIPLFFMSSQQVYGNLTLHSSPEQLFRRQDWQRWFVLTMPIGIFLSAALVNNFVQLLTFRNLSVTLPLLGVAFGLIIRILPRYFNGLVVIGYVLLASSTFIYYAPQVPHHEMAQFMNEALDEDAKFIVNINMKGATAPAAIHYFRDHLNGQPAMTRFFMVNELNSDRVGFEYNIDPFVYEVAQDTFVSEDLIAFENFLADTHHIYYVFFHDGRPERNIYTLRPQFDEILLRDFIAVREMSAPVQDHDPVASFTIIEYRRQSP